MLSVGYRVSNILYISFRYSVVIVLRVRYVSDIRYLVLGIRDLVSYIGY